MEWIAMQEELPPNSSEVLVYAPNGLNQQKELIKQAFYIGGSFINGYYSNSIVGVTHWMLPEAPNVEGKGRGPGKVT